MGLKPEFPCFNFNVKTSCPLDTPASYKGFQSVSVVKNPPVNAGDAGSIPGSERAPRRRK